MDKKNFICDPKKEGVWAFLVNLVPEIEKLKERTYEKIQELLVKLNCKWKDFVLALLATPNVQVEEVPILNQSKLIEISKKHKVEGSNAVAVMKAVVDKFDVVYLAYMKDDELIETDKNVYVNIKSEALGRDVLELFGEEKLIVLK